MPAPMMFRTVECSGLSKPSSFDSLQRFLQIYFVFVRVANSDTQTIDLLRGKKGPSALDCWLQKPVPLQFRKGNLGDSANLDDLLKIVVIRHGYVCSPLKGARLHPSCLDPKTGGYANAANATL